MLKQEMRIAMSLTPYNINLIKPHEKGYNGFSNLVHYLIHFLLMTT